jgi:hypothetical protein
MNNNAQNTHLRERRNISLKIGSQSHQYYNLPGIENVPGLGHTNGARIVVEVETEPPQTTTLLMLSQAKPKNKKYILTRKKNRRKNQNKKIRSSPFLSGLNTVVPGHVF